MTAEQLEALSKAATQGVCWVDTGANSHCFDGQLKIGITCIGFVEGDQTLDDDGDYHIEPSQDAAFITTLVNLYRQGQLILVDDAAVERVAKQFKCSHRDSCYPNCSDGEATIAATAAIAAMGGK